MPSPISLRPHRQDALGRGRAGLRAPPPRGLLLATYEVLYAHAWGPPPGQPQRHGGSEIASFRWSQLRIPASRPDLVGCSAALGRSGCVLLAAFQPDHAPQVVVAQEGAGEARPVAAAEGQYLGQMLWPEQAGHAHARLVVARRQTARRAGRAGRRTLTLSSSCWTASIRPVSPLASAWWRAVTASALSAPRRRFRAKT